VQAQVTLDLRLLPQVEVEVIGQQAVHSNPEGAVKDLRPPQQIPEPRDYYMDCKRAQLQEEARIMGFHMAQEVSSLQSGN
jgi:hypothetical protein